MLCGNLEENRDLKNSRPKAYEVQKKVLFRVAERSEELLIRSRILRDMAKRYIDILNHLSDNEIPKLKVYRTIQIETSKKP